MKISILALYVWIKYYFKVHFDVYVNSAFIAFVSVSIHNNNNMPKQNNRILNKQHTITV